MLFIPLLIYNILNKNLFNLILIFIFINLYYIFILPNQIFYILFSLFIVYISALSILFLLSLIKIQDLNTKFKVNFNIPNSLLILLQYLFIELEYFYQLKQESNNIIEITLLNIINSILYNSYFGFTLIILLGIILILPIIIFITTNKITNKILNSNSLIIWISILLLEIIHLYLFILLIYFSLDTFNILNIFYMWISLLLTSIEASILLYLQFKD